MMGALLGHMWGGLGSLGKQASSRLPLALGPFPDSWGPPTQPQGPRALFSLLTVPLRHPEGRGMVCSCSSPTPPLPQEPASQPPLGTTLPYPSSSHLELPARGLARGLLPHLWDPIPPSPLCSLLGGGVVPGHPLAQHATHAPGSLCWCISSDGSLGLSPAYLDQAILVPLLPHGCCLSSTQTPAWVGSGCRAGTLDGPYTARI